MSHIKSFSELSAILGGPGLRPDEHPSSEDTLDIDASVDVPNDSATMTGNNQYGDREDRMNNPGRYA